MWPLGKVTVSRAEEEEVQLPLNSIECEFGMRGNEWTFGLPEH